MINSLISGNTFDKLNVAVTSPVALFHRMTELRGSYLPPCEKATLRPEIYIESGLVAFFVSPHKETATYYQTRITQRRL